MVGFINSEEEEGACTFAVYILLHPAFAFSVALTSSVSFPTIHPLVCPTSPHVSDGEMDAGDISLMSLDTLWSQYHAAGPSSPWPLRSLVLSLDSP